MVTIKFSTANEAFNVPGLEIAQVLRRIADGAEHIVLPGRVSYPIFDHNGNTIGSFKYTEE